MTTTPGGPSALTNLFSPQRILVVLPALIGAGVAALLLTAGATPLLVQRQQEQAVVKEMRFKRDELPQMKLQLEQQLEQLDVVERQQARLVDLVAGRRQLRTVLAAMNRLIEVHNVQITALELKPLVPYVPPSPPPEPENGEEPPPPPPPGDPLLRPGLEKRSALISLEGAFADLLLVLRQLEQLQVIVIIDDLSLLNNGKEGSLTQLSLSISAYGRSGSDES